MTSLTISEARCKLKQGKNEYALNNLCAKKNLPLRYEKMISSMYLEELAWIILRDLTYCGLVFKGIFPYICKVPGSRFLPITWDK